MSGATVDVVPDVRAGQSVARSTSRLQLLDVLRGISIAIVLASHTLVWNARPTLSPWLAPFTKGALGVGIFFVISGFIITRLLLDERRELGRIDLGNFYLRRASKLCPTLILYCTVAALSSAVVPWSCPSWSYATSAVFLSEIVPVDCWPIQHTWSLSVEELFYLSWAPVMARYAPRVSLRIAVAAVAIAPVIRLWNHAHHYPRFGVTIPFDVPFFDHVDYLAIGCLTALAVERRWNAPAIVRVLANPFVAVAVIYASAIPFHAVQGLKAMRFLTVPFSASLQALVIGCILWHHVGGASAVRSSRNWLVRATAGLGLVSYSLYVWQQLFLTQERFVVHWVQRFPMNLGIALAVGIASFLFLEEPSRKALRRWLSVKRAPQVTAGLR